MSEHWLQHAHGRIVAGDDELEVLADYGWVQITAEEREAIEFFADIHADDDPPHEYADTLRSLLERLHTK
jgi:hypothetical protein